MAIFRSMARASRRTAASDPPETIAELRDEMVDRATRHEILAAQRTDLVVDRLWRRLEAADARLATALQRLEDRVSALEAALGADRQGTAADEPRTGSE